MANTKTHPGKFRCFDAALPDEPIFVLLGRDPAAPATMDFWASERHRIGKNQDADDQDRITHARAEAWDMRKWREKHLDPHGEGVPVWKLSRHDTGADDNTPVQYIPIPAERDGDEAVRVNVQWLKGLAASVVAGDLLPSELVDLIDLACAAPQQHPKVVADVEGSPTLDSAPEDLAHAPEVPPHRFSQFFKHGRYAYARGLEVAPVHLARTLDAMADDGWGLVSIFGQTDSQNIGFIFQRTHYIEATPELRELVSLGAAAGFGNGFAM